MTPDIATLLAHISDLKRQIITLSDSVVSVESRKDRQIEALKEKLVEERARYEFVVFHCKQRRTDTSCNLFDGYCDFNNCPIKATLGGMARQQLKTEMPGVGW